jgi:RNA polymerase sigma-70 factor, ECF subfamily
LNLELASRGFYLGAGRYHDPSVGDRASKMKLNDELDRAYERLLVIRAQARDHEAFRELVERYQRRLLYYIRRILGDGCDSSDVLQDVWLRVFLKLASLRAPEAFRVWLYKIAHDETVSHLRKCSKKCTVSDDGDLVIAEVDPWNGMDILENAELVHRSLERLSQPHREVLTLRFLEDLSLAEIAEVIGCEMGTVKSRLHYAKASLREEMERALP